MPKENYFYKEMETGQGIYSAGTSYTEKFKIGWNFLIFLFCGTRVV
jgi:hypothetical protein